MFLSTVLWEFDATWVRGAGQMSLGGCWSGLLPVGLGRLCSWRSSFTANGDAKTSTPRTFVDPGNLVDGGVAGL